VMFLAALGSGVVLMLNQAPVAGWGCLAMAAVIAVGRLIRS